MKIRKGILIHDLGDSYVAYDVENSLMHTLNETAYFILKNIAECKQQSRIVRLYADHFEVSLDQARADFTHFVSTVKSKLLSA